MNRSIRRALFADASAILLAFSIAFLIKFLEPPGTRAQAPYAAVIAIGIAAIWVACLALSGAYRWSTVGNGVTDVGVVVRATTVAFLITGTISFLLKTEFSRIFIVAAFPIGLVLLALGRRWIRIRSIKEIAAGDLRKSALVLIDSDADHTLRDLLIGSPEVDVTDVVELRIPDGILTRQNIKDLLVACAERGCELVVLSSRVTIDEMIVAELSWQLDQFGIELLVVPSILGEWTSRLNVVRHRSLPLLQLEEPRLARLELLQKRVLDLLIAVPAFILLQPVYWFIALGVGLSSRGPILYVQDRVGAEGKAFPFYKFRSMRIGADEERLEILGRPDEEMAERYRNDPRITPFGRFLRRWSLDELPQVWNVIVGHMSIVGPRPVLFEELPQLAEGHHRRHLMRPGLTGLWQISGRKDTTWDERMLLDLYYLNSWDLSVDLAIIAKTFRVIVGGQGSY